MNRAVDRLIFLGVCIVGAGCYGGNALIAVGQGVVLCALGLQLATRNGGSEGPGIPDDPCSGRARASTWFLLALVVADLCSVLANLEHYDRPISDIKKLRHLLIPAVILLVPRFRRLLVRGGRPLAEWAWISVAGVAALVTLADMVNVLTGFHLFYPTDSPERVNSLGKVRIGGIFSMPNTYAYSIQFTLLVALGIIFLHLKRAIRVRPSVLWVTIAFFALGSCGLWLSGSRGAVAGAVMGSLAFLCFIESRRVRVSLIAGVVAVALVAVFAGSWVLQGRGGDSLRISQWKTAAMTGVANPVLGIGFRQFEKRSRDMKAEFQMPYDFSAQNPEGEFVPIWYEGPAHSNYLEAFASTGVAGALALLGFFLFWLREMWRSDSARVLFVPAIAGFMVGGLFENSFTDGEITVMLMFFYVGSQVLLAANEKRSCQTG